MKFRLVELCLAVLGVLASASSAQAPRAELRLEPAAAEVGQPVRATVRVEHASGQRPTLESLGLDDSWVVFEAQAGLDTRDPAMPDRATTTWVFEIASLEPGERGVANVPLRLGEESIAVEPAVLSVAGVLAEDEDSPRELRGLREIQTPDERATNAWTWIAAIAVLGLLVAIALYWWRIHRKPAAITVSAPSLRLALLEAKPLDSPEDVQAAHFALTRLLRESADLRVGSDRSGLTDEEWRQAVTAQLDALGLGEHERQRLDQLFAAAAEVKYGRERPTHWATREALASARSLALRFESPLPPLESSSRGEGSSTGNGVAA